MEKSIKEYEQFIKTESEKKMNVAERQKLFRYHQAMLTNFQHERLIHLLVTLFFAGVSLVLILVFFWSVFYGGGFSVGMVAFYALVAIIVLLTIAYVKHYYFLENHVQGLYKYTKILQLDENEK